MSRNAFLRSHNTRTAVQSSCSDNLSNNHVHTHTTHMKDITTCIYVPTFQNQMCGADGAHPTVCLDVCSGYEAFTDEDTFAYRYYTVRMMGITDAAERVGGGCLTVSY